jgi:hypothetical protein
MRKKLSYEKAGGKTLVKLTHCWQNGSPGCTGSQGTNTLAYFGRNVIVSDEGEKSFVTLTTWRNFFPKFCVWTKILFCQKF